MIWVSLVLSVTAAELPSVDEPVRTGARNTKDTAVVIGVQDYDHLGTAQYAVKDAAEVAEWLEYTRGVNKRYLFVAEDPNDDELRSVIARGVARVKPGGTLWIYYSGQGAVADGTARIFGADTTKDELSSALSLPELESMAARSRADRVVIIIDAPFDLSGRDELLALDAPPLTFKWAEADNNKVTVWVADTRGHAQIYPAAGAHGLFTYLTLGALRGWADGADGSATDGVVTVAEAQQYVLSAGVALGRPVTPSVEARPKVAALPLAEGATEKGPDPATFTALSMADRDRRLGNAIERLNAEADAALQDAVQKAQAGDPQGKALVEDVLRRYEASSVSITWAVPVPAAAEARALLADPSKLAAKPAETPPPAEGDKKPDGGKADPAVTGGGGTTTAAVATGPAKPQLSDNTCTDLVGMEPDALMGTFSPGRIECVERRLANMKELQTTRDKLSRLLIANAEATQDWETWERLMKRHLEEISRADPDMCFRYALHLSKKGVAYGEEVIRWTGYALENKQKWTGDVYKKRLYHLYRVRTEAAAELWKDAEQILILEPTDENEARTDRYRALAKEYAREWLDYAKASEQGTERPLQLCLSAAGTMAACQE
ncbi:caspase family protein [Myxococcota bacterium]|nr:caspase family protein [Myxococcota bacterium]